MGLLAAVAARSPLTLAGSSGQVIEVAECYCSTSICRLQLTDARPERSRQCQPQRCTPTSYWSLGAGTWVCAHWSAVSQAAFFQERTLRCRSTQLGERGKFLRWKSTWTTLGLILPCDLERTTSGMEPQAFVLFLPPAGKTQAQQPSQGWMTTAVLWGLTLWSHFLPFYLLNFDKWWGGKRDGMQIWYYGIQPQTHTACGGREGGREKWVPLTPTSSHPANTAHRDFSLGVPENEKSDPHLRTTSVVSIEIHPAVLSPSYFTNFKPTTGVSPNLSTQNIRI